MKQLLAVLFAAIFAAASTAAFAQDKKGEPKKDKMEKPMSSKKAPTAAQKRQQACNDQAAERKLEGDERKKFMSSCVKPAAKKGMKKSEKMETKAAK